MKPMSKPERLRQLLCHLRRGPLHEVPVDLLREPQTGTRPAVKLVAHYPKVRQVYLGSFPRLAVFRLLPVAVLWVVAAQVAVLEAWLLTVESVPWWRDAVQLVLGPASWIIVPIVLSLVALNLRRQFAWTRDLLALDLNELRHAAPDSLRQVPWSEVYTAEWGVWDWVRVELENGSVLLWRVPVADRELLIQIMRELMRHHYPNLHGLEPSPANPDTEQAGNGRIP